MADIIVIDDELQVRDSLLQMLRREGHTVDVAVDGNDGLKRCVQDPPRLAIIDIIMPEKEGIETIIELRRKQPGLKIIAISGGGQRGTLDFLDVAKKLGADAALAKPFPRTKLRRLVGRLLPRVPAAP